MRSIPKRGRQLGAKRQVSSFTVTSAILRTGPYAFLVSLNGPYFRGRHVPLFPALLLLKSFIARNHFASKKNRFNSQMNRK